MTDGLLDQADPLDAHDAVPMERLRPWLTEALGQVPGDITLARFGRGYSNLTFLLTVDGRELVLRRPPPGVRIAKAHDMGREHRIVSAIGTVWDKVAPTVAVCTDPDVLGGDFYLMERVSGMILRRDPPRSLTHGPSDWTRASQALVDTLTEIHGIDVAAAGLDGLGRPEGYVTRQVQGWTRRYEASATDDLPAVHRLAEWLAAHQPAESGARLIHNDLKYDNAIVNPDDLGDVRAVLDWEMATIGDPLLDLGTFLAYWVQADDPPVLQHLRMGPTQLPGNLTRTELVERYQARTGQSFDPLWYYAFGQFKNAVVVQQLYRRYVEGHTKEARYAGFLDGVKGLAAVGLGAIRQGHIGALCAS